MVTRFWLRDVSTDTDLYRDLPTNDLRLEEGHEYIIIDCEFHISEYANVEAINQFLVENNVDIDTLKVLDSTYNWDEIVEMIDNGSYTIIEFDFETADWGTGMGVPFTDEYIGLLMYRMGYSTLPCEVPEELVDYIAWEQNWFSLETDGWRTVRLNGIHYIIHN